MNTKNPLLAYALLLFLSPGAMAGASEPTAMLTRSLDRSIGRAQGRLIASTELWQDHSSMDDPWEVKSEHYVVRTTKSHRIAAELAQGLEIMLGHFTALLKPDFQTDEPFTVYIFPDLAAYNTFGDDFGEEHSSFYGSFFAPANPERPVSALYSRNETLLKMWATHSALHQFLDRAFATTPPLWVAEGLASYFTLFWDYDWGRSELKRLDEPNPAGPGDRFIPLKSIIEAPIAGYTDRAESRFIELGMLFSYLLAYRPDTRTVLDEAGEVLQAPLAEYLRAVLEGRGELRGTIKELFERPIPELEKEFRAFDFGS